MASLQILRKTVNFIDIIYLNMRDPSDWTIPVGRVSGETDVVAYHSADTLYRDVHAALQTAVTTGHFIYLMGWHIQITPEMLLIPGNPNSSFQTALQCASDRGALIRGLFWYDLRPKRSNNKTNIPAVRFINSLKNGAALMDTRFMRPFGSAHQKLVLVYGSEGLIAFTGGWDIHDYRWRWIDVQVRLTGGAAVYLHDLFVERWNDHPGVRRLALKKRQLGKLNSDHAKKPGACPTRQVQVVRTYGSPRRGFLFPKYSFAPDGEFSLYHLLIHSIRQAHQYIYVEDQYFFDGRMRNLPDIGDALVKQLTENPRLKLIVITNRTEDIQKDIRQGWFRRRLFYERLCANNPNQVIILQYKKDHHPYIHSKTWIFDDEFALIGSANCNRRSFSYDAEVAVGVAGKDGNGLPFAQNLRKRLWLTHLTPAPGDPARSLEIDLDDWQAALSALMAPNSRLERYAIDGGEDGYPWAYLPLGKPGTFLGDVIWNWMIDPDGS